MGAPLLATKNFIPIPQKQWIERQRLVSHLNAGLTNHHRLTLISASAGAGKSSLLAEWAASTPTPILWVSLDTEDNDPIRFWTYCLSAIQARYPDPFDALLNELNSPQPPSIPYLLNETVNQLALLPVDKLVLVLDDYHVIDAQAVHDSLTYFLDHIPPKVHMVITTRSDPPLPLYRWRGRGQLTEIRFSDLRFTLAETQLFLTERMKLDLKTEDIEQLEHRTEGWIVGLHLAALLMQGRKDLDTFIARFSSNNHYILEYLTNEVLALLSADEQDFLLQISILPRFNSALCDAVSLRSDSQVFLERLWKANLFLIALDDDHFWYRYHHLFADLLGQKLRQREEAALIPLYQRAANWYLDNQMIEDAIRSALAAKNYPMAAELILKNRRQSMNAGDFKRFFAWMKQIPAELLAADARLSLVYAAMLYNNGQIASVEEHLNNAHHTYLRLAREGSIPLVDPDYATLPGQISSFRAMLALRRRDLLGAVAFAEETLRVSLPEDTHSQGMAGIALGRAQSELGLWEEAIATYRQAILTCESSGNRIGAAVCYQQLAELFQTQGRLKEALTTYETAQEQAAQLHLEDLPATGVILVGQAEHWYEKNQLQLAEETLEHGLILVRKGGYLDIQKTAAILKAKICAATGNLTGAIFELKNTLDVIHRASMEMALTEIKAFLALYHALYGNVSEAAAWAKDQDNQLQQAVGLTQGIELFCLARVSIQLGKLDNARDLLMRLEKSAEASNSFRRLAEARLLLALIAFRQNRLSESFAFLRKSIQLVEHGYLRLFLDEGEPLYKLLLAFQKDLRIEDETNHLAKILLSNFPKHSTDVEIQEIEVFTSPVPAHPIQSTAHPLVEKLSERELEVLGLMSEGLTNPDIARRLILSVSTVKTHLANIYGKLNVRNRAEAVLRAKELNLL